MTEGFIPFDTDLPWGWGGESSSPQPAAEEVYESYVPVEPSRGRFIRRLQRIFRNVMHPVEAAKARIQRRQETGTGIGDGFLLRLGIGYLTGFGLGKLVSTAYAAWGSLGALGTTYTAYAGIDYLVEDRGMSQPAQEQFYAGMTFGFEHNLPRSSAAGSAARGLVDPVDVAFDTFSDAHAIVQKVLSFTRPTIPQTILFGTTGEDLLSIGAGTGIAEDYLDDFIQEALTGN